jgi:hypothetical protein
MVLTSDAQSRLRAFARGAVWKTSPWHKDAILGSRLNSFSNNVRFADLVVMAERLHPIPFRTRP